MRTRYIYAALAMLGFAVFVNALGWIVVTRTEENVTDTTEEVTFVTYNRITMKTSDAESVLAVVSAEGFDNTFNHQSTFRDINDMKFHELRKAYIAASQELLNYLTEAAGNTNNIPYYMSYEGRN